ncbi:hypothetical protein KSF_095840 [Reticulibacter mediterranei]|uniref:Phage head morphogenesis domain-containing protein n=1 Tax=Reticulibacter mediterranei TaxID=2778369 RepID=A0A8J3IRN6_9CHLR|nr:phage portal protein [Reticulibacter mediterranei]GHO99536.1 hypothetical protein KSF_095840 [Reticulibacter mediterranei]
MWRWLHNFLYGEPTTLVAVPPTEAIAEQRAIEEARGRTSLIFDSHIMTEAASSKNPQAVSLAWDEGRMYGYNVAPQNWLGMTPRERKETLLSIFIVNPWASNCIDTIARYITSGGFSIEPRPGIENPDERQRDEIDAFLRRINEEWDFNQYVYDMLTDEMIFGEAFTEFTMKDGKPYQLFSIDCLTMDTEHDRYGRVVQYKQQLTSTSEVNPLNPKTIIRWWNPHKRAKVDPFSPLERIQDSILLDKKMINWLTTFFQKGAKFNYYFKGLGDQDEADRFLTWAKANLFGEKNAQIPPVLWGNAEIAPLGNAGALDVDFKQGREEMRAITLSAFHVPPSIACIAESGNRLTDMSDNQRKILQYVSCDPRRHQFFEKFNFRLIAPYWPDYYVSSRYADFRDDETLSKVQDIRIRNGSLTINEVRQEMGRDAYEKGGDVPVFAVAREVLPIERLDEMTDEQRQAAQIAERQATAAADLAELKAKQAKEQPDPHDGNNGGDPGKNAGNDEKSARDPEKKEKEEESQNKLRLDILNAFIDDIKRSGEVMVINEDRPEILQHHTGMMLAFLLDPETARRLAIPGGEPANELHITLAYLGDMEDKETDGRYRPDTMREPMQRIVSAIASTASPLSGRIAGIGRFAPAETDTTPVLALVDIPGLAEFRTELVAALDQAGYFVADNHGYTPHVTLAYIDAAAPTPIETVPQVELNFDTVWLCIGDEQIPFKLGTPVPPGENDAEQETHTQGGETDDVRPRPDPDQSDGEIHQTEETLGADRGELNRGGAAGEGANYTLNLAKIIPRKRWDGPLNYFPPRAALAAEGNQHGEEGAQSHTQENSAPQGEQAAAETKKAAQAPSSDGMASQFDDQGGDREQGSADARRNRGPRSPMAVEPDSRSAEGSGHLEGMAGNESRSAEGREGYQAQDRDDVTSQAYGAAEHHKAIVTAWIAARFRELKERGASSSPTLATAASIYAFSDAEQEQIARYLAEANVAGQRYAYSRDMTTVGLTPQIEEGLFSKVGDLITWGREQVSSIVGTMHEMLTTFVSNLKEGSNVVEQVGAWIDRYADYKAPQVANVAWSTGANNGSMQAIEDIMDAATDPSRAEPLNTEGIKVEVVPSYSSTDECANYAGKSYSLNEYLQLGISWPMHPNCRHSIEIVRKDDGDEA